MKRVEECCEISNMEDIINFDRSELPQLEVEVEKIIDDMEIDKNTKTTTYMDRNGKMKTKIREIEEDYGHEQ